jgi:hypothetical protein
MLENLPVKLTVWQDGFPTDVVGRVHKLEPIHKEVRLNTDKGEMIRVKFTDVVGVAVVSK